MIAPNRYISPSALDRFVPSDQQRSDIGEVRIRIPLWPRLVRVSSIARDLGKSVDTIQTVIDELDKQGEVYHDYTDGGHCVAVVPGHWTKWDRDATTYFRRAYAMAIRCHTHAPDDHEIAEVRSEYQARHNAKLTPRQQDAAGRIAMEGWNES